jgi:Zn finger protein HypA/HybF involved in hydrogenase expression
MRSNCLQSRLNKKTITNQWSLIMSEVVFELICDSCGADYELTFIDGITHHNEPMYCPFCSAEIDLTDVEEDLDEDLDELFDELDFEEGK